MNGLQVIYNGMYLRGVRYQPAWGVLHVSSQMFILHGFARKRDAEIGMQVMLDTGIDFTADVKEMAAVIHEKIGYSRERMKFACEHLQW